MHMMHHQSLLRWRFSPGVRRCDTLLVYYLRDPLSTVLKSNGSLVTNMDNRREKRDATLEFKVVETGMALSV